MKFKRPETIEECYCEIEKLQQEKHMLKEAYADIVDCNKAKNNIMDDVHLGEIQLDEDSVIIGANRGFEVLLGYSEGELHGLTFYDILAEGHDIHDNIFPVFKRTGLVKNLKWKMKTKQGKPILVTLTGRAVYDDNGDFKAAVGLISDITELVHTSEALRTVEREKAMIMDVMQDCIIYYDTDNKVLWANKKVTELSGIPSDELPGKKCYEICHKENAFCKGCPLGDPSNMDEPRSGEIRGGDNIFYIMTYPVLDDNGKNIGLVQIIRDITEQKILEREILEISSTERKKIGNDLHDGLGQILTGISFMSSALINKLSADSSALSIAENIDKQSKRAIGMMKDILRGLCPVSEDPDGLMSALETLATTVTSIYGIKCLYKCCEDIQVHDYDISNNLYLIAREAVTNAVKHSKCAFIEICLCLREDNLILTIKDNGSGFDAAKISSKGHGFRSMKYRTSIIGGSIDFDSKENEGTEVTVSAYIN